MTTISAGATGLFDFIVAPPPARGPIADGQRQDFYSRSLGFDSP